ncbi:MAG: hypothetical protein HY903_22405 [Deltaproteobacteria bacterium]|nr:hypothetical protein [Deltaproteobacteria bacterium]
MSRRLVIGLGFVGLCLAGCIIDTVPLPELQNEGDDKNGGAVPGVDGGVGIDVNAIFYTESPGLLVGTESAVGARALVRVKNETNPAHWQSQVLASVNGSFNLPLSAAIGDQISIATFVGGVEVDAVLIALLPPSADASRANDDLDAAWGECANGYCGAAPPPSGTGIIFGVSPPDADGIVTILAPPGSVADGIVVIVANLTGGTSTAATRFADGSFVAQLLGRSGDQLTIFAVEPAASNAGSTPAVVSVP